MLHSILLVTAISLDSFCVGVSYGANRIKVPFPSAVLISFIGSCFLGVSLLFAGGIRKLLPGNLASVLSFLLLFLMGAANLFQNSLKAFLKKRNRSAFQLKFADIHFMIDVYVDEKKADRDRSKELSFKEAAYLAVALSLDSVMIGLSGGLTLIRYAKILLLSFAAGLFSVLFGIFLGKTIWRWEGHDLSWLSGFILIFLAIMKLFA